MKHTKRVANLRLGSVEEGVDTEKIGDDWLYERGVVTTEMLHAHPDGLFVGRETTQIVQQRCHGHTHAFARVHTALAQQLT